KSFSAILLLFFIADTETVESVLVLFVDAPVASVAVSSYKVGTFVKYINTNPKTNPTTLTITASQKLKVLTHVGSIAAGKANKPNPPILYPVSWKTPARRPVTAPAIQLKINGFFIGKEIP